jgi:16S rRNA (guanine966-N2)-methyltransferase
MATASRKKSRPGFVRIIGGRWRRQRIAVPGGADLRPTPDRVRETLFNWLAAVLPGARCLDLFAGTGVLGLEALSRGAQHAVFIERNKAAAAALETSCNTLDADAEIVWADAEGFLERADTQRFDIVFVDAPYAMAVDSVFAALPRWLKPGAHIYLERERNEPWPDPEGFEWTRQGTAGTVAFGIAKPVPIADL